MGKFVSLHHDQPETDSYEYIQNHKAVRSQRGKASLQICVSCGEPAKDWAWIHGMDPKNISSYDPMCRLCHQEYDRPEWLKEERRLERERIEKTSAYKGWSQERREAQRLRMLEQWSDPEERKKQAERAKRDQPWKGRRAKKGKVV